MFDLIQKSEVNKMGLLWMEYEENFQNLVQRAFECESHGNEEYFSQLSKALDLEIIVEGVETQEQADFLMTMGYRFAQGYHYYKPQPANSFLETN